MQTVTTNSFSMDYVKFGAGDKTMVIIPGLSVDSVMKYEDAVTGAYAPLAEDFTIYLFDRRKDLPSSYSIQDMANDTAEAVIKLSLNNIYLFGASQGGMISMLIAAEHPELVSKLVLGSTSSRVDTDLCDNVITKWTDLAKQKKAKELYLAFGEALYPEEIFEQSREVLLGIADGITDEDLERFVILADSIKGFDVSDRLNDIKCPVLVLGSNDDHVLGGEASREIYAKLGARPDCELYMYDGFGHAAYDLAPDYKERMHDFFS